METRRYLTARTEVQLRDDGSFSLFIPVCPICGDSHRHGAGSLGEDPREYLFHRVGHCMTKPSAAMVAAAETLNLSLSGYTLTDADPRATAELLAEIAEAEAETNAELATRVGISNDGVAA